MCSVRIDNLNLEVRDELDRDLLLSESLRKGFQSPDVLQNLHPCLVVIQRPVIPAIVLPGGWWRNGREKPGSPGPITPLFVLSQGFQLDSLNQRVQREGLDIQANHGVRLQLSQFKPNPKFVVLWAFRLTWRGETTAPFAENRRPLNERLDLNWYRCSKRREP
jgi:hypothetical protein